MVQTPQPFQISLAPQQLWQAINPWFAGSSGDQFGLININLGHGNEATERDILHKVGSYGKQLGHLADALEVVIEVLREIAPEKMAALAPAPQAKLTIALGDIASVQQAKPRSVRHTERSADVTS